MAFKVVKPGLSTTVQDLGRPGYFHLGIPEGGAMDRFALRTANMLVGNDEGAAGLEAVFMGPELTFDADTLVAVTGAEMPIFVDGEPREGWSAFVVKAGQTLRFGFLKAGARIYIAFGGGMSFARAISAASVPSGAGRLHPASASRQEPRIAVPRRPASAKSFIESQFFLPITISAHCGRRQAVPETFCAASK